MEKSQKKLDLNAKGSQGCDKGWNKHSNHYGTHSPNHQTLWMAKGASKRGRALGSKWSFFLRVLLSCWASPKQEVSVILAEEELLSPTALEGKQRMRLLRLTYLSIQSGLLTILPGRQGACKAEWNRTLRHSSKKTEWKGYLQWLKKSKSVLFICPLAPTRRGSEFIPHTKPAIPPLSSSQHMRIKWSGCVVCNSYKLFY